MHQKIKNVTDSLERFTFNTAVSNLMELKNSLRAATRERKVGAAVWREAVRNMLLLMAPITPHIAEELWSRTGGAYSIHQQAWPVYDAGKAAEDMVTLVVQINGKVRDRIDVPAGIGEDEARRLTLEREAVQKVLNGGQPKKVIFVPARNGQEPKVNVVV